MTTIYIVRHGEYENPQYLYPGSLPGYPLSERGKAQVESLGVFLQGKSITLIYASPVLRTKQTAEILSSALSLPVTYDDRLLEVHTWLDGVPMKQFDDTNGELSYMPENLKKGAESMGEVADRMYGFIEEKRKQHEGKVVLIVTHGDPMRFGVMKYMGLPITFEASRSVAIPLAGGYKLVFEGSNSQPQIYPIVAS